MTMAQYGAIGKLYLLGMIICTIWFVVRNGGFKGIKMQILEDAEETKTNLKIACIVMILAVVLNAVIWPIFMHVGIKERLKG